MIVSNKSSMSGKESFLFIFGRHYRRAAVYFMLTAHSHCTESQLSELQDLNNRIDRKMCLYVPKAAVSLTFQNPDHDDGNKKP